MKINFYNMNDQSDKLLEEMLHYKSCVNSLFLEKNN